MFLVLSGLILLLTACTNNANLLVSTLTTVNVSNVTSSTAIAGGTISSDGGATVSARGVCWSTVSSPTVADNKTVDATGTGPFTSSVTGLAAATTYYLRAYATNSEGTGYGNEVSFTTAAAVLPVVNTIAASGIGTTTATSGGGISSDGGSAVTVRGVCWNTASMPTIINNKTNDGAGSGNFSSAVGGLVANTTYYLRAYATNAVGTSYGNEITFTTTAVSANTSGVLSVSVLTSTVGGGYAPKNVVALWVKSNTGVFVKSLLVYAAARKSDLTSWKSSSVGNTTDATTGATQNSNATRTCTWNGTNVSGTVVANGAYILCMEINDGNRKYYEYTFEKGASAVSLTPVNVTGFSNISIKWTPN